MARGRYKKKEEKPPVTIENVYCKHATEKALLVVIAGEEHWMPRSQIHDDSEVWDDMNNDEGKLVITQWIAEQKGLAGVDDDAVNDPLDALDDIPY